jgi:hypothetical protein
MPILFYPSYFYGKKFTHYLHKYRLGHTVGTGTGSTTLPDRRGYVFTPAQKQLDRGEKGCIADGYRGYFILYANTVK